jgi:serine/threonine protein kinase
MSDLTLPPDAEPSRLTQFLRAILLSKLLDREQLRAAAYETVPEVRADPDALADYLVRTGRLSRYQSLQLLSGRWKGLFVGPYQVLGLIGKGGTGKVYLARDQRAGGLVALKVLPPHRVKARERLLARFRREMDICRRVAHPDLARIYETGADRSTHYIAMEYFPGRSLKQLVETDGPLAPERASRLMAEVADVLDHIHRQRLIHRDLKPANVHITPEDRAKLLDLGLALFLGEERIDLDILGGPGKVVGTMDYIAPEQTTDAAGVDERSDIYSLACTLYFALTGRPPFPGGTNKDKIRCHRNEMSVPLSQLRPSLPYGMSELVARMMSKNPADRPASAGIAAAELRRFVPGSLTSWWIPPASPQRG